MVKEFCEKHKITEEQFFGKKSLNNFQCASKYIPDGFNPTVGFNCNLGSVEYIPDGFNPTIGGNLDLRSVEETPEGFSPSVGGFLDLRCVKRIPDGFKPTFYCRSKLIKEK
jgi:hypothetical protein